MQIGPFPFNLIQFMNSRMFQRFAVHIDGNLELLPCVSLRHPDRHGCVSSWSVSIHHSESVPDPVICACSPLPPPPSSSTSPPRIVSCSVGDKNCPTKSRRTILPHPIHILKIQSSACLVIEINPRVIVKAER